MPDFEPSVEARRYARAVEARLRAEAIQLPRPPASATLATVRTTPAAPSGCSIDGDLDRYAPTLSDFGTGGGAFAVPGSFGYWDGRGYSFGFERASGDAYESNPWGGYLYGGLLRAGDETAARGDFQDAVAGWTREWNPRATTRENAETIGDESVVLTRLTPWEINLQQPMVEVFVAFRRCNVNAHYLVTVMPRFKPILQALRYARLVDERLRS